nr:SMP-30/gluconolactonase/LRE family protein [Azohydromonas australica]
MSNTLSYTDATRGLVPIPIWERDLPTAVAEPYFKVCDVGTSMEGLAFDRNGSLLFVDIYNGRILRLSPDRELSVVYTEENLHPAGIAVHKDGRIFVASVGSIDQDGRFAKGSVIALSADGTNRQTIVAPELGHVVDDVTFDQEGGLYFTDFRGTATDPAGGLYYVAPDQQTVKPVLPRMCGANGVALSPDGKVLWATEYFANRLHRMDLKAPGDIARSGSMVPYHFVGRAPDSMRTDSAGNVYVAMQRQGRILVFSPFGMPIGQILLPGREDGHFLQCTSLAIKPGSRELLIVGWDLHGRGSMIFSAKGPAPGHAMYSHH